jgi:methionyl aminopeptidase
MHHNKELQQAAGQVAWNIFEELKGLIKPGLNLLKIESIISERIKEAGMKPAFLGYKGYPAASCLSVNSEIVHGIPRDYELQEGDIIAVDLGVNNGGYLIDTARTYPVGTVRPEHLKLISVTADSLEAAIPLCRAGTKTGQIGQAIQSIVEDSGFAIVRELTGHGVGKTLQEEPSVPNHGPVSRGQVLEPGMVIAVEPITALKPVRAVVLADGWTIDADPSVVTAHFEHTILITDNDPIVLTQGG